MRRAAAKPVRARCVCECVALLPSINMNCVRPPCTARPREDSLHTSQCRLHSLHFKSHTSSHLKPHFDTETKFSHTEAFTQSSFWTQKLLHKEAFTQGIFSTQKLAQGTSQYYFVLKSLHKARPSTTLHYKV